MSNLIEDLFAIEEAEQEEQFLVDEEIAFGPTRKTSKIVKSNGRFIAKEKPPVANGLFVACKKCLKPLKYAEKPEGGLVFPPTLICENKRCKKNKK